MITSSIVNIHFEFSIPCCQEVILGKKNIEQVNKSLSIIKFFAFLRRCLNARNNRFLNIDVKFFNMLS